MARPVNPNPPVKTYTIKQKLKNGGYHVLERKMVYDAQAGRYKILSTTLIGKLPPGETDINKMVPTDKAYSRKKSTATGQQATEGSQDSRDPSTVSYPLDIVLFVMLLAACNGHATSDEIAAFWRCNRDVLTKWMPDFPENDISSDTVRRLIALLGEENAKDLMERMAQPLLAQMSSRDTDMDGQGVLVASMPTRSERCALKMHDTDRGLCLHQIGMGEEENELARTIDAFMGLDLRGALVTTNGLKTQGQFCAALLKNGADYCMATKDTASSALAEVASCFDMEANRKDVAYFEKTEAGLEGVGTRKVWVLSGTAMEDSRDLFQQWPGLESGCIAKVELTSIDPETKETTTTVHYYLSSLVFDSQYIAERIEACTRGHGGSDSKHWRLDVLFNQDRTQCANAGYINGRAMLIQVASDALSKIQANLEKATGKPAPSMSVLMAEHSNLNLLIERMRGLYDEVK